MKNILSLLIIIACVFSISSCNQKNNNSNAEGNGPISQEEGQKSSVKTIETIEQQPNVHIESDELLRMIKNMDKVNEGEVAGMIQDAQVIINYRYKETERKSYAILEKDLWEYEFVFLGKEMSKVNQLAGCWIDFSNDMTYTYGRYQEELGGGKYTYSLDSGLLLLIDNSNNVKPQEFDAKVFDRTLITIGNSIYKDNNYNAKLNRITERPTKGN